LLLWG